jgi:hypothetical protein
MIYWFEIILHLNLKSRKIQLQVQHDRRGEGAGGVGQVPEVSGGHPTGLEEEFHLPLLFLALVTTLHKLFLKLYLWHPSLYFCFNDIYNHKYSA